MSSSRSRAAVAAVALAALVGASLASAAATVAPDARTPAKPRFGLGKAATAEEIAAWDIDVRPDGKGLPPGRGTVAQGQVIYDAKCASCHGTFGESTDYMALAGGVGTLGSDQPIRTTGSKLNHATTLWDYINRAMPFQSPKSLTADEVYALTAYVLNLNDILPADAALDRESLPRVRMPNRDGFTAAHGMSARDGKPDTSNVACMRDCAASVKLASEIPEYARDTHGNLADQMRDIGPLNGRAAAAAKTSGAPKAASASAELAKAAGCMACHGVANKVVGPAFREIGARYGKEPDAEGRLAARVKAGGAGNWGSVPMPAQAHVPDADMKAILRWILAGST